ncbi:bifunctional Thymidylate synthase/Thymidylate synthase-dCMP hydroxymethylase domain/Thymidylate synthase-dCMP hydroxymethylase/Dihydrofolate reductase domain/Thymidylate synthase [Babesia duncani]|uniref:Bifunctional dihydrofolate reductase-thymidylate synthase n=1 Tax=Babesia duncani TaxID=323732 RepID=A0AAD9UQZ8_9APIC|nr:bifunctional Thymidylate synthase/Thymidylate synthase-dCMP hydroxymethylase domain/Thymidylate synthase-dCMP hydroxymethylase/Dihydrofolate reductase domain/Thymidylate synthase [Babesia duncani]
MDLSTKYEGFSPIVMFVATDVKGGIGFEGKIPWPHIPMDFSFFFRGTCYVEPEILNRYPEIQNVVIFGRKTYESIPANVFPLKKRHNVIISRTLTHVPGASVFNNLDDALRWVNESKRFHKTIIMGGVEIYKLALETGLVEKIYLTRIGNEFKADRFFPDITKDFEIVGISQTFGTDFTTFDFVIYEKKGLNQLDHVTKSFDEMLLTGKPLKTVAPLYKACPNIRIRYHQEFQYLDICADVLSTGTLKENRTGIDALSKFGYQMRFDLSQSFPLLTTKKVFLRGITEELIWFINGSTNGNDLLKKNVRIWELNGKRSFLDNLGFYNREEHDLGPVYGFQWRHFGATYTDMHADYKGQGIDQLVNVINSIKNDPNSRRLIVCSWNVSDVPKMALPPCHLLFQFYVAQGKLSCMLHQRSCDLGLGVPFNIASYSILTAMIAQVCNLQLGEFVHNLADAHIYVNHIDALKEQLTRVPYPFPLLKLNKDITDICDFKLEDVKVEGYSCHPTIKMEMAA